MIDKWFYLKDNAYLADFLAVPHLLVALHLWITIVDSSRTVTLVFSEKKRTQQFNAHWNAITSDLFQNLPWSKAMVISCACKTLFHVTSWSNFNGSISSTRLLLFGLLILRSLNSFPLTSERSSPWSLEPTSCPLMKYLSPSPEKGKKKHGWSILIFVISCGLGLAVFSNTFVSVNC